ncbi:helix-turn-helix domain-containing protein [Variovorax rhizosphaerae]|uniref:Helix-turn-helix domain-containing protein n=1 Tax=Variovorax rhizosphaerae TaxID=1836200 RepID=A0ABU8WJE2_9BURK
MARERRERMEARIVEAALNVFAERGPDAPVIDDFISAAGVARGTFYRYFQNTEQLLEATTMRLQDDLMVAIEAEMLGLDDPVDRLATGSLLWLRKAQSDPAWCAFTVRVKPQSALVEQTLLADLRGGKRAGDFSFASPQTARDLVVGTIREGMSRMMVERLPRTYAVDVVRMLLRGLGLSFVKTDAVLAACIAKLQRST